MGCIFVEASEPTADGNNGEVSRGEDKLTLDCVVLDVAVVVLSDVISVDCEETFDDKGSVVFDVTTENSVFPRVAASCCFEGSVVSMSFA